MKNKITNLKEAKKHFVKSHPLGELTVKQLKQKGEEEDILLYGDKAQMLQCFSQHYYMVKLFKVSRQVGL